MGKVIWILHFIKKLSVLFMLRVNSTYEHSSFFGGLPINHLATHFQNEHFIVLTGYLVDLLNKV